MIFQDVIRRKRDGGALTPAEIQYFVDGLTDATLPAEQVAALAMAIVWRSLNPRETANLTTSMARSGITIDWSADGLHGPVLDKHSTGGVGDKVSLMLVPIVAACGGYVPMISGRGLGHTGGTLDKLGGIPGYDPFPDPDRFRRVVRSVGCAIIGQTGQFAPADRRLYAIRDITATVESVPLITASILSKKVAAGLDGLVMDVKVGSGAFMRTGEEAAALVESLIRVAAEMDLKVHALVTDMNQTLGTTAGNAVEVAETVDYLTNRRREARLDEVVLCLAAEMLVLGGLDADLAAARDRAEAALVSGRAAEIFGEMVAALGGPTDFVERATHYLPAAPVQMAVYPERSGYLQAVDARAVGQALIELGGGRKRMDDELDLSVGLTDIAPVGAQVDADRPLAIAHAASQAAADQLAASLRAACRVGGERPSDVGPVIHARHTSALGHNTMSASPKTTPPAG